MNNLAEKISLRKKYKEIRSLEANKNSEAIFSKVLLTLNDLFPINKKKDFIGIYWPIDTEVDLRELRKHGEFSIALPASNSKKNINYHPWLNNYLKKDFHGIPAPVDTFPLKPEQIKLLLVPALAIDKSGYRLGYGGGYFDRLRGKDDWKKIKALLIIPEACISSSLLPKDEWDVPFDGWISEKGFHQIKT